MNVLDVRELCERLSREKYAVNAVNTTHRNPVQAKALVHMRRMG